MGGCGRCGRCINTLGSHPNGMTKLPEPPRRSPVSPQSPPGRHGQGLGTAQSAHQDQGGPGDPRFAPGPRAHPALGSGCPVVARPPPRLHQSHVASRARTGNGEGDDQERVAWRVAFGLSIKAGAGHGVLWESSASPGRGRAAPRPLLLPRPLCPQRLCSASLCHAGAGLKCWCQGGGRGRPSSTGVGHTAPKGS